MGTPESSAFWNSNKCLSAVLPSSSFHSARIEVICCHFSFSSWCRSHPVGLFEGHFWSSVSFWSQLSLSHTIDSQVRPSSSVVLVKLTHCSAHSTAAAFRNEAHVIHGVIHAPRLFESRPSGRWHGGVRLTAQHYFKLVVFVSVFYFNLFKH